MITTTLGHQVNLLLISAGEKTAGTQTVDVLLRYGRPAGGSFLVEENPFSASLIAETQRLDMQARAPETVTTGLQMPSRVALTKTASIGGSGGIDEKSAQCWTSCSTGRNKRRFRYCMDSIPDRSRPVRESKPVSARFSTRERTSLSCFPL